MLQAAKDWVEEKATGYLRTGIQAGGTLAGNAVSGVGGLVESAGQSAANGVTGGIGGVGNYITGYGNSIKSSMSADGPVSQPAKKTAVKPPTSAAKAPSAQKAIGSAPAAAKKAPPKALPSSTGTQKALPAPGKKPPPSTRSTQKPVPSTKPPTAVKSQGPVGVSKSTPNTRKPATNAPQLVSNTNSSGKVMVSAASRPGAKKTAVTRGKPAQEKSTGGDILGIGSNYGDVSKTRPGNSSSKNSGGGGAARKPSAADPLAMGDLENMGKKK